jgi:hypothetical protein
MQRPIGGGGERGELGRDGSVSGRREGDQGSDERHRDRDGYGAFGLLWGGSWMSPSLDYLRKIRETHLTTVREAGFILP